VTGVVTAFDDAKGYGTVRAADGIEHFFHCTAIADGTRKINVGAAVSYEVVAGHLGRWEATSVSPAAPRPAGRP
jgi:cold shock CspA family protein